MSKNFDEFFKKYDDRLNQPPVQPDPELEALTNPSDATPPSRGNIFQKGLQGIEQAGGYLLNQGVKGISTIGQSVMGVFDYLENNKDAYDQLYGKQADGSYDQNAGKFHWDKLDDFVAGAVGAGVSQGQRILQSKNLSELGQNAYTGVDFLKNLPGGAGEFYRDQKGHAANVATAIAGIGIEILFDPAAAIGGATRQVVGKGAAAATKAGFLGERASDVLGRAAGNLASGNVVGGAIAGGAREAAFASREKLVAFANANINTRRGRAAETILEWAMGPSALATNDAMRTTLAKYAALKEDLPKEMLKVANTTATVLSPLPKKQREVAQGLFGKLASSQSAEAEAEALDQLVKLGINRDQAASIGAQYRSANLRLMDIIQESSKNVPQLAGISANMSEYHVRKTYRMFVDPKVRKDWLDYLVEKNTGGAFKIKETNLRNQLLDGLGIRDTSSSKLFSNINDEVPTAGFSTAEKTAFSKNPSGARQAQLALEIQKAEDAIRTAGPGKDVSKWVALQNRYKDELGNLGGGRDNVGIAPGLSDRAKNLQAKIDFLDNTINASTGRQIEKLTARRNAFQALLEKEVDKIRNPVLNTGNPATRATKTTEPSVDWVSKQNEELARMEERLQTVEDPIKQVQLRHLVERKRKKISDATGIDYDLQTNINMGDLDNLDYAHATAVARGSLDDQAIVSNIQEQWVNNDLRGAARPGFNNPSTIVDPRSVTKTNVDEMFPSMREELRQSGDVRHIPNDHGIDHATRVEYLESLTKYIHENDTFANDAFVGFRQTEDGKMIASFRPRQEKAKDLTLQNLAEFTADWGKAKGLTEDQIGKLNAATHNSIVYVPGSREFVSMVKERGAALNDLDPGMRQIIEGELGMSKVDLTSIQDRTLDPVWNNLFGAVDNFSVNAANQGVEVGAIAAKGRLLSELKERGLVVTEADLAKNADLNNLGGWVPLRQGAFSAEGDSTIHYIQSTNMRSIEALDRSLGDMNKMQVLTHASNLFRRAALVTDPSAHATQFLGNIAMLQMMGMKRLFGDDVNLVKGMHQSFRSVMLNDESFKDAVDAGVQVTQTILSGQQSSQLAQSLLTLPRATEMSGDKHGAISNLFRIAQDTFGAGARDNAVRAGTNAYSNAMRKVGMKEGTNSVDAATLAFSPAAMFQMSDQMTRMFAYRSAVANETGKLIKANPIMANFTQDSGTRINWDAFEQHLGSIQHAGDETAADMLTRLKESHKLIREDAAKLANDVALNYSDVPMAINFLSKTGIVPFIKFQYKATGRIMQFVDERPWAFSPYYAAQRNLNDGLNPDPDDFERQREGLSANVRDAMVIPTGNKDSMGRQEFIDLSRWLPFGMYASAANGGKGGEGGLAMQPNSIVSTPILDLVHTAMNMEQEKAPGQSTSAFLAQKLAETFSPAGIGVGSRKVETLARAIEQSAFYVDADGNSVKRDPTAFENLVTGYAGLPERAGQKLTELGNGIMGQPTTTSAFGTPKDPSMQRPRTTVEQAYGRYGVPGVGFSSDTQKTQIEYAAQYDSAKMRLQTLRSQLVNNAGADITVEQIRQVKRIDAQIEALENQKLKKDMSLMVGE